MKANKREMGPSVPRIIARHIFTPFNAFNFAIAVCIAWVGAYKNLLYLGVILCNILIGIVQDVRSMRTVDRLSLLTAPSVRVVRDGKETGIPPAQLCAGEVFALSRGDQICADAAVISGGITVNEALLTGESAPIKKGIGDRLLSGSFVTSGFCTARAEKVGEDCYAASITREAKKEKANNSVILRSLNRIVRFTGIFIVPLGAILFYESYAVKGAAMADAVSTTSAALLGLLPKGLVLLSSVSLAVGVVRLGKRNTLVQELYGIESLARVDVLCMDKTGTLTGGQMRFERLITLGGADAGETEQKLTAFCHAFKGESAVLDALRDRFPCGEPVHAAAAVPFSSERAWSCARFDGMGTLYLGAPEKLLPAVDASVLRAQEEGAHVLLFARTDEEMTGELPQKLIPLAAVCLEDAVRPEAAQTLRYFERQGVSLMIFSGDSTRTTQLVASRAGLKGAAADADALKTDEDREKAVKTHTVFGRVLPEQKRSLVAALQKQGHTVGFLGDGVNDVLAIRQADCGIAMASGCDAARRVAKLVLMDSSFASLPAVVSEGRRVVNNIARVAAFFLTKTCFSFMLSLICAVMRIQYPFEPIQLSIYSVFFEAIPALLLTFRPNAARIHGDIVKDAVKRALPFALAITAGVILIELVAGAAFAWAGFAWMCLMGAILVLSVFLERRTGRRGTADNAADPGRQA